MKLLGQRWVLRVVWELEPASLRFLELRRRMANCSSSMLSERLQQLSAAGLVVKNQAGAWELTVAGAQLGSALTSVWDWAEQWAGNEARLPQPGAARP
jgi:DNA-binding HxlR family transcriptional regulator